MIYIPPYWLKLISLLLIGLTGIFSGWVVFFLLVIPTFLIVARGWKVEPPSSDHPAVA